MRFRAIHKSLFVVIALICAMASSGFAHRFVSPPLDPALAVYLAQGGSLDQICGNVGGSSGQTTQTCDACRLVSAVILPSLDAACTSHFGKVSKAETPRSTANLPSAKLDLTHAPRGPPAV